MNSYKCSHFKTAHLFRDLFCEISTGLFYKGYNKEAQMKKEL